MLDKIMVLCIVGLEHINLTINYESISFIVVNQYIAQKN